MNRSICKLTAFGFSVFFIAFAAFIAPSEARAQRRDYMSEAEIEIVRDEQMIDRRVMVLVKMIDRRFAVLNNSRPPVGDDSDKWGEAPKGTRAELNWDINRLLQKAIDDIDDVAAHNRMDSKLFPKAMKDLTRAAEKYQPQLKTEYDRAETDKERGTILGSMDFCRQIIEASAKVPKEESKDGKEEKKSKKEKQEN